MVINASESNQGAISDIGAHAAFLRYALVYFIVQFRTRLAECFWVGDLHVNRFVNKLGRVTLLITN